MSAPQAKAWPPQNYFLGAGAAYRPIYFKFESYNLQSKPWSTKVFIFMSKML